MINRIKNIFRKNQIANQVYSVDEVVLVDDFKKFRAPVNFDSGLTVCFDDTRIDLSKLELTVRGWIAASNSDVEIIEEKQNIELSERSDVEAIYPDSKVYGFLLKTPFGTDGAKSEIGNLKFEASPEAIKLLIGPNTTLQDADKPDPMWMSFHNGPGYNKVGKDNYPKPIAFYHNNLGLQDVSHSVEEAWQRVKPHPKTDMNYDIDKFGTEYGYDFHDTEILKKQVELANFYGLYGWAFCCNASELNTRSNGVINNFTEDKTLQLNFCIALNSKIESVDCLTTYIADERYIKVDSKPLLIILNEDAAESINVLGKKFFVIAKEGLAASNTPDANIQNPDIRDNHAKPLNQLLRYKDFVSTYGSAIYSYEGYKTSRLQNFNKAQYQIIPVDRKVNIPLADEFQLIDSNPEQFRQFLQNASEIAYENFEPERNFVFIDSWNDWAHNCKLEPDCNYGYGYLHSLKDVMEYEFAKRTVVVLKNNYRQNDIDLLLNVCYQLETNFKYRLRYLVETGVSVGSIDSEALSQVNGFQRIKNDIISEECQAFTTNNVISLDCDVAELNSVHLDSASMGESSYFMDYVYEISEKLGFKYEKVSVAVPNYKYVDYLPNRIDSILYQTYPVYEVLLMDDASNDGCEMIYDKYIRKNPYLFKKFMNSENSGSGYKQWQKAFSLAKGDFLWIAEADDFSKKRFLEKSMILYSKDNAINLVWTRSCLINKKGECFLASWYPSAFENPKGINTKHWEDDYICSGYSEISHNLTVRNTILNVSSVVFKIKDYSKILEEVSKFKVSGDWYLYVSILSQNGKIAHSSDNLNCYTLHEDSASMANCNDAHFKEIQKVQNYAASFCKEEDIPEKLVQAECDNIIKCWGLEEPL